MQDESHPRSEFDSSWLGSSWRSSFFCLAKAWCVTASSKAVGSTETVPSDDKAISASSGPPMFWGRKASGESDEVRKKATNWMTRVSHLLTESVSMKRIVRYCNTPRPAMLTSARAMAVATFRSSDDYAG